MKTDTRARALARQMLQRRARKKRAAPPPVAETKRRFRAVVAYDGTHYAGFQRQRDHVAVQEILEVAIEDSTQLPATVLGAGRTDSGVHADGQVISFDSMTALPASALHHLCEHVLPVDVKVRRLEVAPPGFHPQKDCVRKLYRYTILSSPERLPRWRRVAWQIEEPLDLDAMRAGASHLVGTHDFKAFRSDPGPARRDEETVRTIERIDVARDGPFVLVDTVGPGFLYMMVRNVAATLASVGTGERTPHWVADVLAAGQRRRIPPPAPAQGLTLARVEYEDGFGA